jgi:hypothetical protein
MVKSETSSIASRLINAGASVHDVNSKGESVINVACCRLDPNHQMISTLMDAGADPFITSANGTSTFEVVLQRVITTDNDDLAILLLTTSKTPSLQRVIQSYAHSVCMSIAMGRYSLVKAFLRAGFDLTVVTAVMSIPLPTESLVKSPLGFMMEKCDDDETIIDLLQCTDIGFKVLSRYLTFCLEEGRLQLFRHIASLGELSNEGGYLHCICYHREDDEIYESMKIILDRTTDLDIEHRDGRGDTALIIAASCDKVKAAKQLLEAKADVRAADYDGVNVLMLSTNAYCANDDMFELIFEHVLKHDDLLEQGTGNAAEVERSD